jgi:hypothetical protein
MRNRYPKGYKIGPYNQMNPFRVYIPFQRPTFFCPFCNFVCPGFHFLLLSIAFQIAGCSGHGSGCCGKQKGWRKSPPFVTSAYLGGLFPLPFPDGFPVVLGAFTRFPLFAMVLYFKVLQAYSACPLLLPAFCGLRSEPVGIRTYFFSGGC